MKLNSEFIIRKNQHGGLESDKVILVEKKAVNEILDDKDATFLIAVIGIRENGASEKKLYFDIVGSNKSGNGVSEKIPEPVYKAIKGRQKAFKEKIKVDGKIPIGLKDFPLVIKMEKSGLERIRNVTKCMYYHFYPSIDNDCSKVAKISGEPYFTISILGSEADSQIVSRQHTQSGLFGEETWPRQNFTWHSNVIIPEP
jgi:hypothetical protein